MKLLVVSIVFLIICSCDSNPKKRVIKPEQNYDHCFQYPKVVDSLNLAALYDSARWFIYTWHCDMPYLPKSDTFRTSTFGELELRFNRVTHIGDSVDIDFYFVDGNQTVLAGSTRNTRETATGVRFDFVNKKKLAMLSHNNYSFQRFGDNSRYENPLQPEVIKYIKENWNKLDDCFRALAEKKGIKQ